MRIPVLVATAVASALVLVAVAEAAAPPPAPSGDFRLAVGTVAKSKHDPGQPYALKVRNPRAWAATSVRACAAVSPKRAKVVGVGSAGAVRSGGSSACWIVPSIKAGGTVRLRFDLRPVAKGKGKTHLNVAVSVTGGNSNPSSATLSVYTASPRRPAHRRHRHAPAKAKGGHPVNAILAGAPCTVPQTAGVVFVIDDSESMSENDPGNLRAQAIAVGLDELPEGADAAATTFSNYSSPLFGVTQVSASTRPALKKAAAEGLFDEGDTEYHEAFAGARAQLAQMTTADRKAVVFLSDGLPTDAGSEFDPAVPVEVGGAPIYTIGLGVDDSPEAGSVMAQIAANSGGQYFDAQAAGQLQSIFARIVASLTCNSEQVSESFSLAPGTSRSIPFEVGPGDGEFRSLASWDIGGVTVSAVRPDNTSLTPGTIAPGESFVNESNYALLTGVNPQIGVWHLVVTANQGNANAVAVSIDVFKRGLPLPPAPPPGPGRHLDPCVGAYPGVKHTTKNILGGHEEVFNREASLYAVCAGFGAPEGLDLSPEMQCALVAAAATFGGPGISQGVDAACTDVGVANQLASGNWLGAATGTAAGKACGYFSEVFAGGVGVVAAGATAESGPGAVAVGLYTYRGLAAGLKIACGGLLDGGAKALGTKFEADHETDLALDVTRRGKCMAYRERFHLVDWHAVDCT